MDTVVSNIGDDDATETCAGEASLEAMRMPDGFEPDCGRGAKGFEDRAPGDVDKESDARDSNECGGL